MFDNCNLAVDNSLAVESVVVITRGKINKNDKLYSNKNKKII